MEREVAEDPSRVSVHPGLQHHSSGVFTHGELGAFITYSQALQFVGKALL